MSGHCRISSHLSDTVLVSSSSVATISTAPMPMLIQCSTLMKASVTIAF